MKSKIIAVLVCILIVVIILVSVIVKMNQYDDHKQIEITKEINAGIPFKWEYTIEDENIVKFEKSYVIRDDNKNGIVGASVYTNYVFKGLKEGTTKVIFKFVSITDEDYDGDVEEYKIKVDKDLNISLIGE